MKDFEIWVEGYKWEKAMYFDTVEAETFKEACDILVTQNEQFKQFYNPQINLYYGCRLFNNEVDARKKFG